MVLSRLRAVLGSLRVRLTLWNTVVLAALVLVTLLALREGLRFTLYQMVDEFIGEELDAATIDLPDDDPDAPAAPVAPQPPRRRSPASRPLRATLHHRRPAPLEQRPRSGPGGRLPDASRGWPVFHGWRLPLRPPADRRARGRPGYAGRLLAAARQPRPDPLHPAHDRRRLPGTAAGAAGRLPAGRTRHPAAGPHHRHHGPAAARSPQGAPPHPRQSRRAGPALADHQRPARPHRPLHRTDARVHCQRRSRAARP